MKLSELEKVKNKFYQKISVLKKKQFGVISSFYAKKDELKMQKIRSRISKI